MDAKITKTRLAQTLSYDWLKVVAAALGVIFVWVLVFTWSATRITNTQKYVIHNYFGVSLGDGFYGAYETYGKGKVFSYEVFEVENVNENQDQTLGYQLLEEIHKGCIFLFRGAFCRDISMSPKPLGLRFWFFAAFFLLRGLFFQAVFLLYCRRKLCKIKVLCFRPWRMGRFLHLPAAIRAVRLWNIAVIHTFTCLLKMENPGTQQGRGHPCHFSSPHGPFQLTDPIPAQIGRQGFQECLLIPVNIALSGYSG